MEGNPLIEPFTILAQVTVEKAPDMILWSRPDGSLLYVNPACGEQLGFTEQQLTQKNITALMGSDDGQSWPEKWTTLEADGILTGEHSVRMANGRELLVQAVKHLVRTEAGNYVCIFWRPLSGAPARRPGSSSGGDTQGYELEKVPLVSDTTGIISRNRKYRKVLKSLEKVAGTDATVLIQGETGTGKELLAQAVYQLSGRRKAPLVKVNCAAIPEELAGSELFGHEKGAFTGAFQRKIGRFELAHGGTLFLDEIGELPLQLQPKLLRVLQEGEFERIGSSKTLKVDVRLIAATNRDLQAMVQAKTFREDLFYRLNVFPIYNPPLRERKDDIPLLVKFFIEKFNQKIGRKIKEITAGDMEALMEYDFPGNIRELENIIERAAIISKDDTLNLGLFIQQNKRG